MCPIIPCALLRVQLFQAGKCVYQNPAISDIRSYCLAELDTLWEEIKRFENPQTYFVDLSRRPLGLQARAAGILPYLNRSRKKSLPHGRLFASLSKQASPRPARHWRQPA